MTDWETITRAAHELSKSRAEGRPYDPELVGRLVSTVIRLKETTTGAAAVRTTGRPGIGSPRQAFRDTAAATGRESARPTR